MTDDLEIRAVQHVDADSCRRVVQEAFGDEGDAILGVLGDLDGRGDLARQLLAEVGGVVVGLVALSRAWLDARERLVEVLVLSPLAVVPSHERRGIGGALIDAALVTAAEEGSPLVFVEGSPTYYAARGFEPASAHGVQRPSARIPDAAAQVALLESHEPWMTGAVVYPDCWWRRDLVGLRDPLLAELEGHIHS